MVVEKIFKARWIEKRPVYSFYLGIFFTLIAFLTSILLFRSSGVSHMVGISTILFTLVLTLPGIAKLFDIEEQIEVKENWSFFKEHEEIFDFFIYYFLGVFLTFFIISLFLPGLVFSQGDLYGVSSLQGEITVEDLPNDLMLSRPSSPDVLVSEKSSFKLIDGRVTSIFLNNLYIIILCFVLSILYGAGALFLIILNASIWASRIAEVVRLKVPSIMIHSAPYIACNLGVMAFHMIPEVGSYVLAAISGGVLSKALTKEEFLSKNFLKVFKDAVILITISIVHMFFAAIIEVHASAKLFKMDVCQETTVLIILFSLVIITFLVIFEVYRKKHHHRHRIP
ncbi:MAG: hypothetical protein KKF89_04015 [Nanoarchaeota archaeon]|nr:hypothetical protein [Nanoarchaeota archaeon]MBU1854861.1 hypothetical protein [Nanoarchaeota archaeon]